MAEPEVIGVLAPGGTYQHFVDYIRDPDTSGLSQGLNVDLQPLAEQAHVHRDTISHAPGSRGVQNFSAARLPNGWSPKGA